MSIETTYLRVRPEEFTHLIDDPQTVYSLIIDLPRNRQGASAHLQEQDASARVFRIHKEWHALHFLLTGESDLKSPSRAPPPLGNVVMGGTPTPISATYGPVRSLNTDEVRAVAEALGKVRAEELKRRFDPARRWAFTQPKGRKGWDEEDLDLILDLYPRLVEFFTRAAEAGDMVLISSL
jgi:hypothetical protein